MRKLSSGGLKEERHVGVTNTPSSLERIPAEDGDFYKRTNPIHSFINPRVSCSAPLGPSISSNLIKVNITNEVKMITALIKLKRTIVKSR